ncbi:MAG TPA: ATP-binding SpoIIE family protein phosphatase [Nitrospiraceae bacterium]|nr:ATP-binding SpoIIE family protein phosphatase [Nitrospiraceae bacterium]
MADHSGLTAPDSVPSAESNSFTLSHSLWLPISDSSQVSGARRAAADLSRLAGFSDTHTDKAGLIVTELGTNLVKHGGGGELYLHSVRDAVGADVLEIMTLDRGTGIANTVQSLSDGYSTAGSAGTGLGAIRRLSDAFDLYSQPGRGTVVLSRLFSTPWPSVSRLKTLEIGAVTRPKKGEEVCGDHWSATTQRGQWQLLVADGLGHGPLASEAAMQAARLFRTTRSRALPDLLAAIHGALRSTRGAAVAIADVDLGKQLVRFAGVGNIAGAVVSAAGTKHMVSLNGTAGVEMRKVTEFSYPWADNAVLVLHSDGLVSHWNMDQYPGLCQRHPTIIAGVLCRDHERGRDDVTVVVAKQVES